MQGQHHAASSSQQWQTELVNYYNEMQKEAECGSILLLFCAKNVTQVDKGNGNPL